MQLLPIEAISEVDQPIFGANIFNLAKLKQVGLPVPKGLAISPPEIILQTILEYLKDKNKEVITEHLTIVESKLRQLPAPADLDQELKKHKGINRNQIWTQLLLIWWEIVKIRIWQEGFSQGIASNLPAQVVVFLEKYQPVKAFFDPDLGDVVIQSDISLNPSLLKQIDELVMLANKKLFLPQIYQLAVVKDKVWIVSVAPFTQSLPASKDTDVVLTKNEQKKIIKSAVKVFLNLSTGFAISSSLDGVLVEGERSNGVDDLVFRLAEAALAFPTKPVIFKLSDQALGDVRGTLRLLSQKSLLESCCQVITQARHKKDLFNVELAIPFVRSDQEFLEIKKELAVRGIHRKGTLKFWLELAVPENFVNLQDYLTVGVDGIILDLDNLQSFLGGYDLDAGEYYKKQVRTITKFIEPGLKTLHQNRVPFLAKGALTLHPDILDFLIEAGVWGVVANTPIEAESLPEHLNWSERRMVTKKLA
ncbi:hypothetical protein HY385_00440 [Candidatus Daviesbacteria bacterium]|nr:hypothetical protein [Candidatus Daviesbacteria bacterium]